MRPYGIKKDYNDWADYILDGRKNYRIWVKLLHRRERRKIRQLCNWRKRRIL